MYEKTIAFLENQKCKSMADEDEKVKFLLKEKVEFIWDTLMTLTQYMTTVTDGKKGSYTDKLSNALDELKKWEEERRKEHRQNTELTQTEPPDVDEAYKKEPLWIDDDGLVEFFRMILSQDYEPPINNLVGIQVHLWVFYLYYRFFIYQMKASPSYVMLQVDWSFVKMVGAVGMIIPVAGEYFKNEDSKYHRQVGMDKASIEKHRKDEALKTYSELMKKEEYMNQKTGNVQHYRVAKEVGYLMKKSVQDPPSDDSIVRWARKDGLIPKK